MVTNRNIDWPAATVAIALIALIGAIIVTAILKYDSVDEALKIWGVMSTIVGLLVGGVGAHFFSQKAIDRAEDAATEAQESIEPTKQAFAATMAKLNPADVNDLKAENQAVRKVLGE